VITNDRLATAVDSTTLLPIYEKINRSIYYKRWREVDAVFLHIDIPRMSDVLLMGLLRLTYTYRHNLKSWLSLRNSVQSHFKKKGVNIRLPEVD
jgi:hypothetical protein